MQIKKKIYFNKFLVISKQSDNLINLLESVRSSILSKISAINELHVLSENHVINENFDGYEIHCVISKNATNYYLQLEISFKGLSISVDQFIIENSSIIELENKIIEIVYKRVIGQKTRLNSIADDISDEYYQLYLKAKYIAKNFSPEDHKQAIEIFETVLKKYPNYSPARASLASSIFQQLRYGVIPKQNLDQLNEHLEIAKKYDLNNVESHTVEALTQMYFYKDFKKAGISFQNALSIGRDKIDVLKEYCWYLLSINEDELALNAISSFRIGSIFGAFNLYKSRFIKIYGELYRSVKVV